jgi:glyceraldehyde 3-phosphate dehydrogenase
VATVVLVTRDPVDKAPIRVGINGFGRIGRLVVRALRDRPDLKLVHINELVGGVATAAHLLEFDTVHGRFQGTVGTDGTVMRIDGHAVTYSAHATPGAVPWGDHGVDLVLECSGAFKTTEALIPHFETGVRKVIVAAPVKSDGVLNIVMGCNDDLYNPASDHIVTAASCTTNCLAPVVKVLHEQIGIERGVITTIHDVTNTQVVVDAPHADLRRARSALNSLIPTSTGSATAITMIYPELAGKLDGLAVRVPLLNASLTDAVFTMSRDVTVEEVNNRLRLAADGPLKGILGFEDRPLVSADYTNDTRSGIVDGPSTLVVDQRLVKVLVWYDNEYGYAFRMADLASKIAASLPGQAMNLGKQ